MNKLTQEPLFHRWWARSAIGLLLVILIPIGISLLGWTESPERGIAIGVCAWMVGMIFQIVHLLRSFRVESLELNCALEAINEDHRLLIELQSRLQQIAARLPSNRSTQVFIDYCRRSLNHTLSVAAGAARGELTVQDHHFSTVETVLAAFEGCEERIFRCVWRIGDGELFDDAWRRYMQCLVELNRNRPRHEQVQIRILFVADNESDDRAVLRRPPVAIVFGFVSGEETFECRLMSGSDYDHHLRDVGLHGQCIDFGVYGSHLLFTTTSYKPTHEGIFTVDRMMIQRYRRVHDDAMAAPTAQRLPSGLQKGVSLQQFLDCDNVGATSEASAGRRGVEQ